MFSRQWICRFPMSLLLAFSAFPILSLAQNPTTDRSNTHGNQSASHGRDTASSLAEQLRALQTKVATLEAALKQRHPVAAMSRDAMLMGQSDKPMTNGSSESAMSGMGRMSGMGQGRMMNGMSGQSMVQMGMSGQSMSDMGMGNMSPMGNSGVRMMGRMSGMGQMQMVTALPGFPGASHLYHIGATSFFLDHSHHITLTQEQQNSLNTIKENALLAQATFDRQIAEAEQELWVLTSAAMPDAAKIEAQIREIEKQGGDKRIAFIRAVGQAAEILTDEQRQSLVGMLPDHNTAGAKN